jgi:hypothetical protein
LSSDGPLRHSVLTRLREEPGLTPVEAPVDAVAGAVKLAERTGR